MPLAERPVFRVISLNACVDHAFVFARRIMLVDRSLIQLSVHQLPDDNLRVTVFLKAEIAAVHISCNDLMNHDAAMTFCDDRENAVAERIATLNLPPGGIAGLHHFLCVQYVLNLCNSFCRALHQIFLGADQIAVVMAPVIVAVEASPGDKIIGNMLADAKDKFGARPSFAH